MSAESKKRQRRRNQPPALNLKQLTQELLVLEGKVSRLINAHETNTKVFVDALHMSDAQIHVMQRALNDSVMGETRLYKTESGGIDFYLYMCEYWGCIGFSEFVAQMKARFTPQKKLVLTSQEAEQDNTVVFGGA